jgi:hypothetical protein
MPPKGGNEPALYTAYPATENFISRQVVLP